MSKLYDLNGARFSRATALDLAKFSALVYMDEPEVRAVLEEGGFKFSWMDRDYSDTQLFIASDDDVIVVCFRGTASVRDWLTDLKTKRLPYEGVRGVHEGVGEVHRGFWGAFDSVNYELIDRVHDEHGGDDFHKPVLVTGHSLGGALAAIAADQLAVGPRNVRLYTFGQPRVFGALQAAACLERLAGHHRFVNNNDVVARVPFSGWGFRHAGRLNHIDHTGKFLLDPAPWMTFADRVMGRFFSRKLNPFKWSSDGIDDHSMTEYVRLLTPWAEPKTDE